MNNRDTWWQRLETGIIICGYRVAVDYEVEVIWHESGGCTQRYTGCTKMFYVPA
jgi:hypothetical protein